MKWGRWEPPLVLDRSEARRREEEVKDHSNKQFKSEDCHASREQIPHMANEKREEVREYPNKRFKSEKGHASRD